MSNQEPLKRSRKRLLHLLIGAGAILAALVIAWFFLGLKNLILGDDGTVKGPESAPFTLKYPKDWEPLNDETLKKYPGPPLAVVKSKNKNGVLIVKQVGAAPKDFNKFSKELTKELGRRFKGFKKQSSKLITVGNGQKAFYYSYVRGDSGTSNTVVIVPVGSTSFELNSVITGGDTKTAVELAAMIQSFTPGSS